MPPEMHAVLSASSSSKWLHCTPSARLEEYIQQQTGDTTTVYAEEGRKAHAWAERLLTTEDPDDRHDLQQQLIAEDPAMAEYLEIYTGFVAEVEMNRIRERNRKYQEDKEQGKPFNLLKHLFTGSDMITYIEQRVDFSDWVPDGYGTADCIVFGGDVLHIIDLKYGEGVRVEAAGNTQLRLYALGAYSLISLLYEVKTVRMSIVQPRRDHIATAELSAQELLRWGEEIRNSADKAWRGEGNFTAGVHCTFCKARSRCKTYAENMLLGVNETEPQLDNLLTDEELASLVLRAKDIKRWLTGIQDMALDEAMNGRKWPGLKLVHGRTVTTITDPSALAYKLKGAGYGGDEIYKPQELLARTNLEKLVGKKRFTELAGDLLQKEPGAPTLVSADDKREEIDLNNVSADFDDSLLI